jgi:hypothetical protein
VRAAANADARTAAFADPTLVMRIRCSYLAVTAYFAVTEPLMPEWMVQT